MSTSEFDTTELISKEFREELKAIMESGIVPPLAPQRKLLDFRKLVEMSSVAVVKDGIKHEFRYNNFGAGWSNELFRWFIRHTVRCPGDIAWARNLMIETWSKHERERRRVMPWSGGTEVPL